MQKIKVFLIVLMLFTQSCSLKRFWQEPTTTYVGTLSVVMQKKHSSYWFNLFGEEKTTYKLHITLPSGKILVGTYEDIKNKFKPGDFVEVTVSNEKIIKVKKLKREILEHNF